MTYAGVTAVPLQGVQTLHFRLLTGSLKLVKPGKRESESRASRPESRLSFRLLRHGRCLHRSAPVAPFAQTAGVRRAASIVIEAHHPEARPVPEKVEASGSPAVAEGDVPPDRAPAGLTQIEAMGPLRFGRVGEESPVVVYNIPLEQRTLGFRDPQSELSAPAEHVPGDDRAGPRIVDHYSGERITPRHVVPEHVVRTERFARDTGACEHDPTPEPMGFCVVVTRHIVLDQVASGAVEEDPHHVASRQYVPADGVAVGAEQQDVVSPPETINGKVSEAEIADRESLNPHSADIPQEEAVFLGVIACQHDPAFLTGIVFIVDLVMVALALGDQLNAVLGRPHDVDASVVGSGTDEDGRSRRRSRHCLLDGSQRTWAFLAVVIDKNRWGGLLRLVDSPCPDCKAPRGSCGDRDRGKPLRIRHQVGGHIDDRTLARVGSNRGFGRGGTIASRCHYDRGYGDAGEGGNAVLHY